MSAKVGRPRIPEDQAQAVLYGARVSRQEAATINRKLDESDQTPSEVIKKALRDAARPQWTVSPWKYEDLQGKQVEFRIVIARQDGRLVPLRGVGKFSILRHAHDRSRLAIQIQIDQPEGPGVRSLTLFLGQSVVDRIERHPDPAVADFRCLEQK